MRHPYGPGTIMVAVVTIAILLLAACASEPEPEPPPVGAVGDDYVTEDELILHAAQAAAGDIALLIAAMFSGGNPPIKVCGQDSTSWDQDRTITANVLFYPINYQCDDGQRPGAGSLVVHTTFGDSFYSDGDVNVGQCRKLPGAGTKSTGEYRELTNETNETIERTISHTVEESHAEDNSLSESLELTNGQTIEAGGGVPGIGEGKATITFEQKFGIEHGHTESSSTTHSETVEDKSPVDPGKTVGAAFTLDDSITLCPLDINSVVDWSTLHVRVWRHHCRGNCGNLPGLLNPHHLFTGSDRNVSHDFEGVDDLIRLALGHSTACDRCDFNLGQWGHTALSHLENPKTAGRLISLKGERRTTVKDSASVVFRDITGLDGDCVAKVLGTDGTPVGDLDDELAKC